MTQQQRDVFVVLTKAPWIAGGTGLFLLASTLLFGARYLTLIFGAVLGLIGLGFMLVSFWKRNATWQSIGLIVIASAVIGLRAGILPALHVVSTALFVMALPLCAFRPAIARRWGG